MFVFIFCQNVSECNSWLHLIKAKVTIVQCPNTDEKNQDYFKNILQFIHINYDNFVKGYYVFMSCAHISSTPEYIINKINSYIKIENTKIVDLNFKYISDYKSKVNLLNTIYDDDDDPVIEEPEEFRKIFHELYTSIFGKTNYDVEFEYWEGDVFVVSNTNIHRRTKDTYKKLIDATQHPKYSFMMTNYISCLTKKIFTDEL
jgi:hypothetical protein